MNEEHMVKIPQHRHCLRCGRAFTSEGCGERFCSKECFEAGAADAKKKLRKYILVLAGLWAIVIAAVLIVGI